MVGGTTAAEFLFLFVAPVLYVIHAPLTGLGFTIAGGARRHHRKQHQRQYYRLRGVLASCMVWATKWWYLVPVVAAIWFTRPTAIFRFRHHPLQSQTPGRDIPTCRRQRGEKAVAGISMK